MRYEDTAMNIP